MERFKVKWCKPLCYVLIPLFIIVHSIQFCIELNLLKYFDDSIIQLIVAVVYALLVIPFGLLVLISLIDMIKTHLQPKQDQSKTPIDQSQTSEPLY
ncbi:MAG: hypothetical protein KGZ38_00570 [Erysipelothrix sp.]|jgi:TRAP-type C4-dicarboxylate transport system permease small subunit|nr:hypothetical protein [Erysipelothrix sp.]